MESERKTVAVQKGGVLRTTDVDERGALSSATGGASQAEEQRDPTREKVRTEWKGEKA